jgi:hypothetical protein
MEDKQGAVMSIVRDNILNRPGYTPYCGGAGMCGMPRTEFDGEQFKCPHCGWRSGFEAEFIERYKARSITSGEPC